MSKYRSRVLKLMKHRRLSFQMSWGITAEKSSMILLRKGWKWNSSDKISQINPSKTEGQSDLMLHTFITHFNKETLNFLLVAFEFRYHAALSGTGSHFFPHLLFLYHPVHPGRLHMEAIERTLDSFSSSVKKGWGLHTQPHKSNLSPSSSVRLSLHQQENLFILPSPLKI